MVANSSSRTFPGRRYAVSASAALPESWSGRMRSIKSMSCRFAPPKAVEDLYTDRDPLSRAHHQARDKKVEGGPYGEVPTLFVKP
jgi:hypothetical protein